MSTEIEITPSEKATDPMFPLLVDGELNTPAFITGSRAYGKPSEESDTDICIYMPDANDRYVQQMLKSIAETCDGCIEYEAGGLNLRFGKLNLIVRADLASFRAWEIGTKQLVRKSKVENVTREEAIKLFDELEAKFIDVIS